MTIKLEIKTDSVEELLQALQAIQKEAPKSKVPLLPTQPGYTIPSTFGPFPKDFVIGPGISPNHLPGGVGQQYQPVSWAGVPRENNAGAEGPKGA